MVKSLRLEKTTKISVSSPNPPHHAHHRIPQCRIPMVLEHHHGRGPHRSLESAALSAAEPFTSFQRRAILGAHSLLLFCLPFFFFFLSLSLFFFSPFPRKSLLTKKLCAPPPAPGGGGLPALVSGAITSSHSSHSFCFLFLLRL